MGGTSIGSLLWQQLVLDDWPLPSMSARRQVYVDPRPGPQYTLTRSTEPSQPTQLGHLLVPIGILLIRTRHCLEEREKHCSVPWQVRLNDVEEVCTLPHPLEHRFGNTGLEVTSSQASKVLKCIKLIHQECTAMM